MSNKATYEKVKQDVKIENSKTGFEVPSKSDRLKALGLCVCWILLVILLILCSIGIVMDHYLTHKPVPPAFSLHYVGNELESFAEALRSLETYNSTNYQILISSNALIENENASMRLVNVTIDNGFVLTKDACDSLQYIEEEIRNKVCKSPEDPSAKDYINTTNEFESKADTLKSTSPLFKISTVQEFNDLKSILELRLKHFKILSLDAGSVDTKGKHVQIFPKGEEHGIAKISKEYNITGSKLDLGDFTGGEIIASIPEIENLENLKPSDLPLLVILNMPEEEDD